MTLRTVLPVLLATLCAACSKGSPTMTTSTAPIASTGPVNEMAIACRPSALTAAEREHSQKLRAELSAATTQTLALVDGYAFRLRSDVATFAKAAEWITIERRCCPFLAFDLRWSQGDDTAPVLGVTGPDGTKDFLAAEMPELPRTN